MKNILKMCSALILSALLCTAVLAGGVSVAQDSSFSESDMFYIEKQANRDFVILQFTDTHVPSASEGKSKIFPVMRDWVDKTDPDMIVITGDGVNGTADGNDIKALIEEMNSYQRPWAYIFGNHEKDGGLGIRGNSAILAAEAAKADTYLLYKEGPFTGEGRYGNYVINIEQGGKPVYSLFMFDSGREYETFLPSQTQWYADGVKKLSEEYYGGFAPFEGKVVPSMVFHHIPTDEYQYAANSVLTEHYELKESENHVYEHVMVGKVPSKYGSGANYEFAYGMRDAVEKNKRLHSTDADKNLQEYAMYEDERTQAGFFSVVKDLHSTTHMFCGHRHTNDATITYEGVTLTFGTKTGSGNSAGGVQKGCTTITIKSRTNAVEVAHKYN